MQKIVRRNKKKTSKLQIGGGVRVPKTKPRLSKFMGNIGSAVSKGFSKVKSSVGRSIGSRSSRGMSNNTQPLLGNGGIKQKSGLFTRLGSVFTRKSTPAQAISFVNPMFGETPTGMPRNKNELAQMERFLNASATSQKSMAGRFPGGTNYQSGNTVLRRQIINRRKSTGAGEAQGFINRARAVGTLNTAELEKYNTVLSTIQKNPDTYGKGKRTSEQKKAMYKLANQQGLDVTKFDKLYSQSGTTALLNRVKKQIANSQSGYISVSPVAENTGYMTFSVPRGQAENAGYVDFEAGK